MSVLILTNVTTNCASRQRVNVCKLDKIPENKELLGRMCIVLKMQLFLNCVSDNQFDSGKMPLGLFH